MLSFIAPYADEVIAVCQALMSVAVIPVIWAGRKRQEVPVITSGILTCSLYVVALALLSQSLPIAALTCAGSATLWDVVLAQRLRQRR